MLRSYELREILVCDFLFKKTISDMSKKEIAGPGIWLCDLPDFQL